MKLYTSIGPEPSCRAHVHGRSRHRRAAGNRRHPQGREPGGRLSLEEPLRPKPLPGAGRRQPYRGDHRHLRISGGPAGRLAADRLDAGGARRDAHVDAPGRSQYLRAARQRLPLRRRAKNVSEPDALPAGSLGGPEGHRAGQDRLAERVDGGQASSSAATASASPTSCFIASSPSASRSGRTSRRKTKTSPPGSSA